MREHDSARRPHAVTGGLQFHLPVASSVLASSSPLAASSASVALLAFQTKCSCLSFFPKL